MYVDILLTEIMFPAGGSYVYRMDILLTEIMFSEWVVDLAAAQKEVERAALEVDDTTDIWR